MIILKVIFVLLSITEQTCIVKVVFTSTGGISFGSHGLLLRESMFDESLHVPLLLSHPTLLPQKRKLKVPVSSIDVLPTVLDLVTGGHSVESHTGSTYGCDGMSLMPLISNHVSKGDTDNDDADADTDDNDGRMDRPTVSTNGKSLFAVRTKMYKLIWDTSGPGAPNRRGRTKPGNSSYAALYNLKDDALELHNIIDESQHQEITRQLLSTLQEFWQYIDYVPQSRQPKNP